MKNIFLRLTLIIFVMGLFPVWAFSQNRYIVGNGNLSTSEKKSSEFDKINTLGSVDVRFHISPDYRIRVTTDANLVEYVEIETKANILNIGIRRGMNYTFTKFLVDVYAPRLTAISKIGSGSFESFDTITSPTFETNITGSGKTILRLECNHFLATISGSGKIEASGQSENLKINISGSGGFNGTELKTKNANVRISGSGNAKIYATEKLNTNISGSGRVSYLGEPSKIDNNVSGSGRVVKM